MFALSLSHRFRVAAIAVVTTAAALCAVAPPAAAAPAREPILFVHGWRGSAANWDYMWGRFQNEGYTTDQLARFTYDSTQSNKDIAVQVKAQADALRARTGVNYGTWWSPCDEIIDPDESTVLNGATNIRTACLGHLPLLSSAQVFEGVRDFVR
ncbi:hypothetical protein AB0I35_25980 [Nocardia sp. NPDC050378]|uniref:esterase/lipase family protein n=1 Tax=Nocardia sp. NPDC050378 TaxID=3155400 RepID=UPI0033F3B0E5